MPNILDTIPHCQLSRHDIKSEFGNQVVADIAQQLIDGKVESITQPASGIQSINKIELSSKLKLIPNLENELGALLEKPSGNGDVFIENDLVFKWSFDEKRKLHKRPFYTQWYNGKSKGLGIESDFIYWPYEFYIVHDCCQHLAIALKKVDENNEIVWILLVQLKHESTPEQLDKTLNLYRQDIENGKLEIAQHVDTLELPVFNVKSEVEIAIPARYTFNGVLEKSTEKLYQSDVMNYKQKAYLELTENGWYGHAETSVEFRTLAMPQHGKPNHYIINGSFGCCIFSPHKPGYFIANINEPGINDPS